jgi:hypothetical protein
MALTLWTTFGLVVWLTLWALGSKSFDSAMLAVLIIVIGATIHLLKNYLPNRG